MLFKNLKNLQPMNKRTPTYSILLLLVTGFFLTSCKQGANTKSQNENAESASDELVVSDQLKWSERMALSEIHRFPDPTLLDFADEPNWSYTNGLVLQAMSKVYELTGNEKIYDYIYEYGDRMIEDDGTINAYDITDYNLDMIKSGDVLYYLFNDTDEQRFRSAMDTLHLQLEGQPKTASGGYWHKKRYPNQMWLDGVYMAEPFHAKYAMDYLEGDEQQKVLDNIVKQFDLIEEHNRDPETGLYYHGWDESKKQRWADNETGLSQHFWSRGMGWYGMALVDILDFIPESHEGRERIINYLNRYAEAIVNVQDETGVWYQVLNLPEREGNYLEATGSSMFTYTLAKGVNKGYLPESFMEHAQKAYQGIQDEFITIDDNGVVNLTKCCSVAGLGGDPYRDGSFEYYISEKVRPNDPKGTGPFILASLELDK